MNGRPYSDTDPDDSLLDHLSLPARMWLAFCAGVTRRLDLLPVSGGSLLAQLEQEPDH